MFGLGFIFFVEILGIMVEDLGFNIYGSVFNV